MLCYQGGTSRELLGHVRAFLQHREDIGALWTAISTNTVSSSPLTAPFSDALLQQARQGGGGVVETIDELYEAAAAGKSELDEYLKRLIAGRKGVTLKAAPLKARARVLEKARDDYSHRPPPAISHV
jgi:hypothetical protein